MPWQITQMSDVRREFVTKALQGGVSFAMLCPEYGVSRKTGYKWKERAVADGLNALAEHIRRPHLARPRSENSVEPSLPCLDVARVSVLIRGQ